MRSRNARVMNGIEPSNEARRITGDSPSKSGFAMRSDVERVRTDEVV